MRVLVLDVLGLDIITDFEHYCGICKCIHSDKLHDQNRCYYHHTKTCKTTVCDLFAGGIDKNPSSILEKISICIQQKILFYLLSF